MTLLICGTARQIPVVEGHKEEVWSLATSPLPYSDRIYGFHDEPNATHSWRHGIPKMKVVETGLPLNNSICIMLANAIVENRFDEIKILGSPLSVGPEYTKERPALAVCVWYCRNIARIPCEWEGGASLTDIYMFI